MNTTTSWHQGELYLSQHNEIMRDLIAKYGPCTIQPRSDYFSALCESIISQQLAAKAADAIYRRFNDFFHKNPTPEKVSSTPREELRGLGLSNQKTTYLLHLAEKFLDGTITPQEFAHMPDDTVISQLTSVKGIGIWTAQIFLLFALNRPDVFPVDDLGLKKAVQRLHSLENLPDKKQMENAAEPWQPFRSLASWYLWRSLANK